MGVHKFEQMPGNRKNQPCNRCLEFKRHPNHDLSQLPKPKKATDRAQLHRALDADNEKHPAVLDRSTGLWSQVVIKDGKRYEKGGFKSFVEANRWGSRVLRGEATDRAQLHRALDAVMDRAEVRSAGKDAGLNIAPKVTRDATICHKCGQIVRCSEGYFKPHSIPGLNNGQTCSGSYKVVGRDLRPI